MVRMPEQRFDDLVQRAARLVPAGGRALLGVAGAPGAGKTTLALALVRALTAAGVAAVHVPMDGFHLADVELARLGRAGRKGAPDTFDAAGYAALLQRLRAAPRRETGPVYAPAFDREIDQPVAGSIPAPTRPMATTMVKVSGSPRKRMPANTPMTGVRKENDEMRVAG